MPKPLLTSEPRSQFEGLEAIKKETYGQNKSQKDKLKVDRLLRKPRSKEYLKAVQRLDAGGHAHNEKKVAEIIEIIKEEFPEVEIVKVLIGCVAICYLGEPYEVHTLDIAGGIIEHYPASRSMPTKLEAVRSMAIRGGYEFIEVYYDCYRAVSSDGSVSVIPIK